MWELLAWAAAILTAIATAAGLFWSPLYRDAPYWTEQARGIDLATLFLAVPILVVSLWLVRQGSAPAGAAAIGVLLYLVYNYVIYSISVAMNRLAFVYIAILGLCIWTLILHFLAPTAVPSLLNLNSPVARVVGGFLVVVAALFGLLWLSQIAGATISGIPPVDVKRTVPAGESGLCTRPRDLPAIGRRCGGGCVSGLSVRCKFCCANAFLALPNVSRCSGRLPICSQRRRTGPCSDCSTDRPDRCCSDRPGRTRNSRSQ